MANPSKYRIQASPQYETVSPGAVVSYWCQQTYATIESADAPRNQFQWFCVNDPVSVRRFFCPSVRKGPARAIWKDAEWSVVGRHVLQCHVKLTDGTKQLYEHVQTVEAVQAILARELDRSQRENTNSPDTIRTVLKRYIQLLKDIEKHYPIQDSSKKSDHDELVARYEAYYLKLDEVLKPTDGAQRFPIHAVHLASESQERSDLNVFVARIGTSEPQRWVLVDWTNPCDRTRTSQHEAEGRSPKEAIQEIIESWSSGNRYAPGRMRYEVPAAATSGEALSGEFSTSGKTTWDELAGALEWIGLVAAGVAAVACLVAPVPGSSLISAAIWTSIFSSSAAAVINIGQRHEEGFGNWQDDAFDSLTIVGNLFAGVGMWAKGATLLARNAQGQLVRAVLVGQLATDSVQGVLIAANHIQQYDAIMSDGSLTPDERARKLLELFRSLAVAGALTYVSVKGTAADLANVNARPKHLGPEETKSPAEKLKELADPAKEVDLTKPPKVESTAEQGKSTSKVQVGQERAAAEARPQSPFRKFDENQDWVVYTIKDDEVWLQHTRDGGPRNDARDWVFHATYTNGDVELKVRMAERDAAGNVIARSDRLRGKQCYEMMFEHFESAGHPIKRWVGEFAWDNYKKVKAAMARGLTPEEAALESVTAPFWKAWADRKGLKMKVVKAIDAGPDDFQFAVEFLPR